MHILVNTGGGDAPGLNAVIRAVTLSALRRGWKVTGIKRGYQGLLEPDGLLPLTREAVRGIAHLGGTILGTLNKGHPFEYPVEENGKIVSTDISDKIMQRFREVGADALIAIGVAGQASIDKVAGPVGEALIMTAIGLAVAVPAVLLYNYLVRRNKVINEKLRSFASDLQTYLITKGR